MIAVLLGFWTRKGPFCLFSSPLRGIMTSYLGPVSLVLIEAQEDMLALIKQVNQFIRQQWKAAYNRFTLQNAPADGLPEMDLNWKQRGKNHKINYLVLT